jgi:cation:H+ antiporter
VNLFLILKSRREAGSGLRVDDDRRARAGAGRKLVDVVLVLAGLVLLVIGSRWLVGGAVAIATTFGVSELVIGLTMVAAGTSLPEVATSILATIRGERDIAVGNVVGSNIFNVLAVLGFSSLASPGGVPVAHTALTFDIPVMIAVAVACLPIFVSGYRIGRPEALLFLMYYVAYTTYLVIHAADHRMLPAFRAAMVFFVLPLTAITLIIIGTGPALRRRRKQAQ